MAEKQIEFFGSDVDMPSLPPMINIVDFDNYRLNNWSNNSSTSHHEITEEEEEEEVDDDGGFKVMPSIGEEYNNDRNLFSFDNDQNVNDVVYVVTWRGTQELCSASMDALVWTLGTDLDDSSIVYLVHVFPELRFIPTPLGRLPLNQANPEQKEAYLIQERSKRREYLHKFLSVCSSAKVQVETVLIESDMEAKAILDLIPVLNIRKLVLGTTKSNLKKLRNSSKKGGGETLDQIVHNAPPYCEVKVICEGKEVQDQLTKEPPSPSPSSTAEPSPRNASNFLKPMQLQQDNANGFVNCSCFKI
ncbi:uncharacterized protein [Rutidosis leptorrhynchoides]|uniref:uncharacterized protein n=1 Tax=Rutidosis leptorrhynchoides TaxID=125765 RepID=UPI003A99595F